MFNIQKNFLLIIICIKSYIRNEDPKLVILTMEVSSNNYYKLIKESLIYL